MWVPDNEWGPGWVTWRRSEGYYGWAPIGPGISIDFAYGTGYNVPYNQWTFVRDRDFGRTNINNYYVNSSNNVTIINKSTVINNFREDKTRNVRYNAGPDRTEVERRAGKTFTPLPIKESSRPGENLRKDQLQIYKPQVQKNISDGRKPAPSKVANMKDVKTPAQRTGETPSQKGIQPAKQQQPPQEKRTVQPAKQQQPPQEKRNVQPAKQQQPPQQQQRNAQPAKQQPPQQQQQKNVQPAKQQPPQQQQQRNAQPAKQQQPPKEQRNVQPPKQQSQPEGKGQPPKQQQAQAQPQHPGPPIKQMNSQPQQTNPSKSGEKDKQSPQDNQPKNMEE